MAKIIKRYQWLAKDDYSAERPRRRCGAQEKPPGIFRPRNIPARWSGAVTSHVPFSNFGDHRSGAPLPKIFWGVFFSGVLGFLDARRGGAGPSPLYGPNFLTIRLPKFFGIKNRVPKTYIYQSAFCKRGRSLSASLRKRPKCCVAAN